MKGAVTVQDGVFEAVRTATVDVLEVSPQRVTPDTHFEHLGANSLKMVEIIMTLEERFDFELPEDENLTDLGTVGGLCDVVRRYRKAE